MNFQYPLGLLGLIGIPILILIYIIKNKYTEQTVASTYLWRLSERFLRRKNPISRLTGIIALILQILSVLVISLLIAHPVLTVPNAANEYCFILDGSGSMRMETDGKTRFDAGKEEVAALIDGAADGSRFSLILVGDRTDVIFERLEDKEQAHLLLSEVKPAFNELNTDEALERAQAYFEAEPSLLTYLVTDAAYKTAENVTVINVAGAEQNHAIDKVTCTIKDDLATVTGEVISYGRDAMLTVNLYVDGADEIAASVEVVATADQPTAFSLTHPLEKYASLRVAIEQSDSLSHDNEYILYDLKSESSYNTLIVSERPFFIKSALAPLINASITTLSPDEYTGQTGYGLYVFDSLPAETLTALPKDGTVWIINPVGSVEGAGFSVQGEVAFSGHETLSHTTSSSSLTASLTEDLRGESIAITRYVKCNLYRNFTTLLSYKGNPVLFAGTNAHGNREVVFAFDLHDSNVALLHDYAVFTRNLVRYSFPDLVDKTTFECGADAVINVPANCTGVRVESPLGNVTYLDTASAAALLPLDEVGVYKITMTVADTVKEFNLYSAMTETERVPLETRDYVGLSGAPSAGGFDGKFDPFVILCIFLAVIFSADWMVYCYEKYQLR